MPGTCCERVCWRVCSEVTAITTNISCFAKLFSIHFKLSHSQRSQHEAGHAIPLMSQERDWSTIESSSNSSRYLPKWQLLKEPSRWWPMYANLLLRPLPATETQDGPPRELLPLIWNLLEHRMLSTSHHLATRTTSGLRSPIRSFSCTCTELRQASGSNNRVLADRYGTPWGLELSLAHPSAA